MHEKIDSEGEIRYIINCIQYIFQEVLYGCG